MSIAANRVVDGEENSELAVHGPCSPNRGQCLSALAPTKNVGDRERLLSAAGGAVFALWGLSRGAGSGWLVTGLGAALIYRGMTGHCYAYDALGLDTAEHPMRDVIPATQAGM